MRVRYIAWAFGVITTAAFQIPATFGQEDAALRKPEIIATLKAGDAPQAIAVNAASDKIYVVNYGITGIRCNGHPATGAAGSITLIDGATDKTEAIGYGSAEGPYPYAIAVDASADTAYLLSHGHVIPVGECTIFVPFQLARITSTPPGISVLEAGINCPAEGIAVAVAVDEARHKVYAANLCGNVKVFDAATNRVEGIIPLGFNPSALAVNTSTNKIYVAGSNQIAIIDGATFSAKSITTADSFGGPHSMLVNEKTNKIYASNFYGKGVTVLDGATEEVSVIEDEKVINPGAMALNEETNKIYVAGYASGNVMVIDGQTNTASTVHTGNYPCSITVNPSADHIFVANLGSGSDEGSVTMIEGATNATLTLKDPKALNPIAAAYDSVNQKVYVANRGSNNVTVMEDLR
jgi:YVTN family beta-propeller protein